MTHGSNWRTFPGNIPRWIRRAFDPYVHALTTIGELHRNIHDGMIFNWTGKGLALANEGVVDFLLVTGAKPIHMNRVSFFFGRGDVDMVNYSGVTTSANGSDVSSTIKNVNEESTNTDSTLTVFTGPTVTDIGTLIHTAWAPPTATGQGQTHSGTGIDSGEEWVLKPNTKYLWRITNNSGVEIDYAWDNLFYDLSYEEK